MKCFCTYFFNAKRKLSPTLFNIYTNDQPVHDGTRSFIYADDLCITAQFPTFSQVESTIEEALGELTEYYRNNSLRANPGKTQVTAFHLRNREAKRSLKVSCNGVDLENTTYPKHLGVTLDRTLSYKQHIQNTKMKVATRTKRIQPARGWCATVGGEHCTNCIHLPRLSGSPATQFFGEASRASPQHGWQSAYSLRETLSPTLDQNQH